MSSKDFQPRMGEKHLSKQARYYRRKKETRQTGDENDEASETNPPSFNDNLIHASVKRDFCTQKGNIENGHQNKSGVFEKTQLNLGISEDFMDTDSDETYEEAYFYEESGFEFSEEDITDEEDFEEDIEEDFQDRTPKKIKEELRIWYISNTCITATAFNSLLKILKKHIGATHDIPSDVRSLVKTSKKIDSKNISGGESVYFGLKMIIEHISRNNIKLPETLIFDINVDGAQVFDNPYINSTMWPILMTFTNIEQLKDKVFPISIFYGAKKPDSLEFIDEFINEYESIKDGVTVNGNFHKFKLNLIRCDVPAHSFLCCTIGHTGYYSCWKCNIKGEYFSNKVVFAHVDEIIEQRTNLTFRERKHEEHHHQDKYSNLLRINELDMIKQIPIDAMHSVHLGMMKRLLSIWFVGRKKNDGLLDRNCYNKVSDSIKKLKGALTAEFHRNLRSLEQINKYKAKEFRMFLHYIGIIVLKNDINERRYKHFLKFHCAIRILSDEDLSKNVEMRRLANKMIEEFNIDMEHMYGKQHLTYNFHLATHLSDEVGLHGPLDDFSNFCFENALGYLKKMVKSPFKPLKQICNQYNRIFEYSLLDKKSRAPSFNKNKQSISINGIVISTRFPNCIVRLKSSHIMRITKFETIQGVIEIFGYEMILDEFFDRPIRSSTVGCFLAKDNPVRNMKFKICDIKRKMIPFKLDENNYVLISMTHNVNIND